MFMSDRTRRPGTSRPRMMCPTCGKDAPQRVDGTPQEHTMPPSPAEVTDRSRRMCAPGRFTRGAGRRLGLHCSPGHNEPCRACGESDCCAHCVREASS